MILYGDPDTQVERFRTYGLQRLHRGFHATLELRAVVAATQAAAHRTGAHGVCHAQAFAKIRRRVAILRVPAC
jgi:hypothetical protein